MLNNATDPCMVQDSAILYNSRHSTSVKLYSSLELCHQHRLLIRTAADWVSVAHLPLALMLTADLLAVHNQCMDELHRCAALGSFDSVPHLDFALFSRHVLHAGDQGSMVNSPARGIIQRQQAL